MKQFILSISLILGATVVSANDKPFAVGDVFFCQMEEFVQWNWNDRKLQKYVLEKFKFSIVNPNRVKFGGQGYLGSLEMEIDFVSQQWVSAQDDYSIMNIRDGKFSYAQSTSKASSLIAATCDRF